MPLMRMMKISCETGEVIIRYSTGSSGWTYGQSTSIHLSHYTIEISFKWADADWARYCPSIKHAMLLLSLLSRGKEIGSQNVPGRPGLVILWNLGSMMMDTVDHDENVPEPISVPITGPDKKFKKE